MRRLSIAALLGAALLACLAGCLGAGEDPAGPPGTPPPTFDPAQARAAPTFEAGLQLEVAYSGNWSGAYGSPEAMHSDDGEGNRTFPLPAHANGIQAIFQKQETTDEPLVLRLVRNGTVIQEASGAGPLAVVTLQATPAPSSTPA
jgi:hypothetical protein